MYALNSHFKGYALRQALFAAGAVKITENHKTENTVQQYRLRVFEKPSIVTLTQKEPAYTCDGSNKQSRMTIIHIFC